jgi:hypothetical protein
MQWVLATVSLLLCLVVVALIVAGRRRIFWLIALGPVLALFVHRFVASPMRQYAIVEDPPPVNADAAAAFLQDGDYVVGAQFGDGAYAYPYAALFSAPVVLQSNHEQRFVLLWSAFANRALAFKVDREIKAAELQIVSMPADALLLYNGRNGQFINGVTGQTTRGETPAGLHAPVPIQKLAWGQWRRLHPATLVIPARDGATLPAGPIMPRYAVGRSVTFPAAPTVAAATAAAPATQPVLETQVVFAPTTRPLAVPADAIGAEAANVAAGETQLLLLRDNQSGLLHAFDRRVQQDLFPLFRRKTDPKRPAVALEDQDSGTEWTADGKAVDGPLKGEQLHPVPIEDAVYWGVMKHWYPDLQWVTPTQVSVSGNFKNQRDGKRRR